MIFTSLNITITLFSMLGYGFLSAKIIRSNLLNINYIIIQSLFLLIFFSIFLNFFISLNSFLTNVLFIISFLFGVFYIYKYNFNTKSLLHIITLIFLCILVTYKSYAFDDYTLYHLPYIEIIRDHKIIFGLANLHERFGHVSVFQNISALNYNYISKLDSFIFFTPILLCAIIFESIYIYQKNSNLLIKILCLVFISFYLINSNRYGSLGNDYPSHALAIFGIIILLKNYFNTDNKIREINIVIFIFLFAILSKLSLIFYIIVPIIYLALNKNYKLIYKKNYIFILFIFFIFLFKNLINTSCFVYPINHTCIDTFWKSKQYSKHSPLVVSAYGTAWSKSFSNSEFRVNQKKRDEISQKSIDENKLFYNNLNDHQQTYFKKFNQLKYYNKLQNWVPVYLDDHFKNKIVTRVFYFLTFLFFLILLTNIKRVNFQSKNFHILKNLLNIEKSFIILSFIGILIWFLNFPLLRYGISFIILIITSILFIIFNLIKNKYFNLNYCFYIILILGIINLNFKNFIRINNFETRQNFSNNIVPLDAKDFIGYKFNNIEINKVDGVCSYTPSICIDNENFKFFIEEYKLIKKNNYIFIVPI